MGLAYLSKPACNKFPPFRLESKVTLPAGNMYSAQPVSLQVWQCECCAVKVRGFFNPYGSSQATNVLNHKSAFICLMKERGLMVGARPGGSLISDHSQHSWSWR